MKVLCYQDIWNLVKNGVTPNGDRTTNDQKATYKELKNKDYKVLFTIHQCVDANNFESSKEAWDILDQFFDGDEKVKKAELQTHKRQYELLQMEENESILDFFTRVIIRFVNQIMVCGEVITTKLVIVKILRSLTPKFNYLVGHQEEFLI
jgi:hypothetical protein